MLRCGGVCRFAPLVAIGYVLILRGFRGPGSARASPPSRQMPWDRRLQSQGIILIFIMLLSPQGLVGLARRIAVHPLARRIIRP
jgi:ABC-type branched-subunit amino acid transport system permease subunit